jgi:hypothetical protein
MPNRRPATPSAIIVYLPEFGLYDDPAAQFAPFSVLGNLEYDRPVVRASDGMAPASLMAGSPTSRRTLHPSTHEAKERRTAIIVVARGICRQGLADGGGQASWRWLTRLAPFRSDYIGAA